MSNKFGESLGKILGFLNISQRHFAELTGLTPACICQIVNGKREPSLSTIVKIIDTLGHWTFEEMVHGSENI